MKSLHLHLAATAVGFVVVSPLAGQIVRGEAAPPASAEERVTIKTATHALTASGEDLAGLEALVASFPPEVIGSLGTNVIYMFDDPDRRAAWAALLDWYSIDFLERVMNSGSDEAAYWALRKVSHQAINGPRKGEDPTRQRIVARGGVVTDEVRVRLTPALEKMRGARSKRTRNFAREVIARFGVLMDRGAFLKSLEEQDETRVARAISEMLDIVRINPRLTEEIWAVLARAQSDQLILTSLRYPWLFELPAWDQRKATLLARFVEDFRDGIGTNVNTALSVLALSSNPLAEQILSGLAKNDNKLVRQRAAEYQKLRAEKLYGR